MKKIGYKKLANGIQLISKPLVGLRSMTVEVMVGVGSKYEKVGEHGLSHFLEHMMFKGTRKRPTAEEINREIDSRGAISNAGTGQELTSYYITTVSENRSWAIDLLSDILIHSKLDEVEIKKEGLVIAEEIKMYQDNPMSGLSSEFLNYIWGESDVGCWNISGEVDEVLRYKKEDLVNFWNKYYSPERMVVVVAGDLKGDEFDLLEEGFGSWNATANICLPIVEPIWAKVNQKTLSRSNEQGHFVVGLPGVKQADICRYEFKTLDAVLAGSSSSKLFQKLREDLGWAYYIYSVSESLIETGVWAVQSGVSKEKLDEAIGIVKSEIADLTSLLSKSEVDRAINCLNGKTKLAMDRTDFWTSILGERMLLENKLVEVEDELDKLSKVTMAGVLSLAEELTNKGDFYTLKLV